MNREIKFRFWLGHTKKMTYGHTLQEVSKVIPEFTDDIIPLQYTGMKDMNGKEIYEKDFLFDIDPPGVDPDDVTEKYDPLSQYYFVEFDESYAAFMIRPVKGGYADCIGEHNLGTFEVAGNIFENPELIGGTKERVNELLKGGQS